VLAAEDREALMAKTPPYFEVDYAPADVSAVQAWAAGTATPEQQKRAYEWVMLQASRLRDLSFQPDNAHATAFAEGRRFVALQIAKLQTLRPGDVAARDRAASTKKERT
jgi:hypothetical protein